MFNHIENKHFENKVYAVLLGSVILLMIAFLMSCSTLNIVKSLYPEDNFIEEEVEDFIYDETGVEIDFTGSTPE